MLGLEIGGVGQDRRVLREGPAHGAVREGKLLADVDDGARAGLETVELPRHQQAEESGLDECVDDCGRHGRRRLDLPGLGLDQGAQLPGGETRVAIVGHGLLLEAARAEPGAAV
jgi:hypothetical protein